MFCAFLWLWNFWIKKFKIALITSFMLLLTIVIDTHFTFFKDLSKVFACMTNNNLKYTSLILQKIQGKYKSTDYRQAMNNLYIWFTIFSFSDSFSWHQDLWHRFNQSQCFMIIFRNFKTQSVFYNHIWYHLSCITNEYKTVRDTF